MIGAKIIRCILLISFTSSGFAQNSLLLKQKKQHITKEIEALKNARDQTDKNKKISSQQINNLNAQINLREEKISIIDAEVKLLANKIVKNVDEVKLLENEYSKLRRDYAKLIQLAYRQQSAQSQWMLIFSASNFNEAYKRLQFVQQFNFSRKKKANDIQTTQKNITIQIIKLDKNKRVKSHLLLDEISERLILDNDKQHQAQLLKNLIKQEQTLTKRLSQKQREAKELNYAIQNAIRKEIQAEQRRVAEAARIAAAKAKAIELARLAQEAKAAELARQAEVAAAKTKKEKLQSIACSKLAVTIKAKIIPKPLEIAIKPKVITPSILSVSPETKLLTTSFIDNKGKLPKPTQGIIIENFGTHVYKNITINNPGITIKTNDGAPVNAIFNGQVSNVLFLVNSYTVIVRHGEYFSIYSKLKNVLVSAGQKITMRQHLGNVATNVSDGTSEMSFQIWNGPAPINPTSWFIK